MDHVCLVMKHMGEFVDVLSVIARDTKESNVSARIVGTLFDSIVNPL